MAIVSPRVWNPEGVTYYQLNQVLAVVVDGQDPTKVRVRFVDSPYNDLLFDRLDFEAAYAAYIASL